jgi:hypothetical protein
VQNHIQQGTVDCNLAVVINKTQFPKTVHEKAHARSRPTYFWLNGTMPNSEEFDDLVAENFASYALN